MKKDECAIHVLNKCSISLPNNAEHGQEYVIFPMTTEFTINGNGAEISSMIEKWIVSQIGGRTFYKKNISLERTSTLNINSSNLDVIVLSYNKANNVWNSNVKQMTW